MRRSVLRLQALTPWHTVARPHASFTLRSRQSSTFCPTNIAELLTPASPLSSSPSRGPSDSETLTVHGYVRSVRKQKRIAFAAIGDGSTLQIVQAVLPPQLAEELVRLVNELSLQSANDVIDSLSTGAAVTITGKWKPSPGGKQSHELQVEDIRVLGANDATTSPIQKKYQSAEYLRTIPHLRPRLPLNALLLRLRSLVTAQVTSHFARNDFIQCHPPIITSSDCEGAGEVFTVEPAASAATSASALGSTNQPKKLPDPFFGSPKYLTVSSQLHLEALAQSIDKVWTLSPTFRAEKSDTARHLSEFYMLEAEIAFVDDLKDVMDVVENMLRSVATELQSSHVGQELLQARARDQSEDDTSVSHNTLAQRWQGLIDGPWPRITYAEAIQHLKDAAAHGKVQFEFAPEHEDGLQTEHERYLAEHHGKGGPIFVTDYPRSMKPFYMSPSTSSSAGEQETPTVACFDLLVPELCELVGGSMREHRLPELQHSMVEHGLRPAADSGTEGSDGSLQWYMDLRRYGSVPHGGFGLGFDRLLCYLSGVQNIRDIVAFPRYYKKCDC